MRSLRAGTALFILCVCFCLPSFAQAATKRGPKIRWFGERPQAAQAGREFVGQVEIITPKPVRFDGVQVTGTGWSVHGIDGAGPGFLGRGDRRVVTFRGVPQDPTEPLTIRAILDGEPVEKTIRLDAASLRQKRRISFRDPQGPKLSGSRPRLSPGVAGRAMDQQISFTGAFQYQRGDGVWVGADNIIVKIWDDDSPDPFDEVIWSGTTDGNGHFEGWVIWDDCDISGCDDPDVYLEIITTGQVADVQQDDLLETTWSWETEVIGDFTGNNIDFGLMTPGSDPDGNAAVHIFTSMVRAHRFAWNRHNMNAAPVDVLWPDEDDGTHYNQFFEEIHVARERTWNELTHAHEFAHHLHNEFGNLLDNDYENGFCDTPNPGHCLWCRENVGDAWQEGFANWYGQVVTEDYPVTYSLTPWAAGTTNGNANDPRYNMDGLGVCQEDNNQPHPGALTEGYVMALLRDMSDPAAPISDDHDGDGTFDCDTDGMDIGTDEIMAVFRDHDPTDITMFLNSFRQQNPQHEQDLWSAARNVDPSFGFELPAPFVLTQPPLCRIARAGESHTIHVLANGSMLQYQWRRNGVNLSNGGGISGAQDSLLTLSPLTKFMTGNYDCVVKTCDGTREVVSIASRLTVLDAPVTSRPHLTWGENGWAQCGDGTKVFELPPGAHTGLTDIVQMDGGRIFSMALRSDGRVYTWGHTDSGELGNGLGFNNQVLSPTLIALTDVLQITAGHGHALSLHRDGTVRGWGGNGYGEIGNGQTGMQTSPQLAILPGCIIALSAGHAHTLALRSDGTVVAFGNNALGSLGIGTTGGWSVTPTEVVGLTDVIAIAAAGYSSFALKSDGTVWAWGYNAFGQLGNGSSADSNVPVQVSGLTGIRSIAASYYNGYAIRNTGEVYAWGRGDMGSIGDGSAAWRFAPVQIPGLTNPQQIVAGDAGWAMALLQDGTLRAWGYNVNGVLATGAPFGSYQYSHAPVVGVVAANSFASGTATAHVLGHLTGVTAVEHETAAPLHLALRVAPVPSRSNTSLAFDLPSSGPVSIAIFDVAGRLVRSVVSDPRPAGRHTATWDGRSRSGVEAPAGVYFARLERGGDVLTRRIVLVR